VSHHRPTKSLENIQDLTLPIRNKNSVDGVTTSVAGWVKRVVDGRDYLLSVILGTLGVRHQDWMIESCHSSRQPWYL